MVRVPWATHECANACAALTRQVRSVPGDQPSAFAGAALDISSASQPAAVADQFAAQMALTLILRSASSKATDLVKPTTPNRDRIGMRPMTADQTRDARDIDYGSAILDAVRRT